MASLKELFEKGTGGRSHKWHHYFEIYERHFNKFENTKSTYLEIGVGGGGTLDIMREYLGKESRIVGIDIDENLKSYAGDGKEMFIGDQADIGFLTSVVSAAGPFDIIVDDGGHTGDQQITSFLTLFPHLNYGGIYLVEDLHTTFWLGHQNSRYGINFYDFARGLVEKMSLWNVDIRLMQRYSVPPEQRPPGVQINNFALTEIFGIHFYDSICVIEKRKIPEPSVTRL